MVKAMFYKWDEIFISELPFLLMAYLNVYFPWLGQILVTHVIGPARIKALKSGGDIWNIPANFGIK